MAKLRKLTWWAIAVAGVCGAAFGYVFASWQYLSGASLPVPWIGVVVVTLLAAAVLFMALTARRRVASRRDLIDASVGLTWFAMARAAVLGGACALGCYVAMVAITAQELVTPLAIERFWVSLLAALLSAALLGAGLWLERLCYRGAPADQSDK